MKYRPFGNTGIMVSEIGMGTNTISGRGSHGYVDEAQGIAAVERAYDLGVTFFDTAEGYSEGRSEEVLGKVLANKPDAVICTKVGMSGGPITPERIRPAAEASLRRLRRDVLDVYLVHNPTMEQVRDPAIREALEALRRDGLIRSYGVSTLEAVQIEQGEVVLQQEGYSSLEATLNIAEQEAADGLLPRARQSNTGIIIRSPLGSGLLTGKYHRQSAFAEGDRRGRTDRGGALRERRFVAVEDLRRLAEEEGVSMVHAALAWVLSHEAVSTVIPGAKDPSQVEENVAAGDVALSASLLEGARALRQT